MSQNYEVTYDDFFIEEEWQFLQKGWYPGLVISCGGKVYRPVFYVPEVLLQVATRQLSNGKSFFFLPDLVLIAEIDREHIDAAVLDLAAREFAELSWTSE